LNPTLIKARRIVYLFFFKLRIIPPNLRKNKYTNILIPLLTAFVFSAPGFLLASSPVFSAAPRLGPLGQPEHGWSVCAVLNMENIPGVPDPRQVFELCHSAGWRMQVYCLNPGVPYPQLGTQCSEIGDGHYWCGDGVQELQVYGILQTPEVEDTATPTPTSTMTSTATITPTTQLQTTTPTPSQTSVVEITPTASATAYNRPRAGGPGSLDVLAALLLWVVLITSAVTFGWCANRWHERKKSS
jgi:hypothetical protein